VSSVPGSTACAVFVATVQSVMVMTAVSRVSKCDSAATTAAAATTESAVARLQGLRVSQSD
jgi:hypothetical protein